MNNDDRLSFLNKYWFSEIKLNFIATYKMIFSLGSTSYGVSFDLIYTEIIH